MHKKAIISVSRAIGSVFNHSLYQQLNILKEYGNDVEFDIILARSKTDKNYRKFFESLGINIRHIIPMNKEYYRPLEFKKDGVYASWDDWLTNKEMPLLRDEYDFSFLVSFPVNTATKLDYRLDETFLSSNRYASYDAIGSYIAPGLLAGKLAKENYQIVYDQDEPLIGRIYPEKKSIHYHGYDNEKYRYTRLDSLQYIDKPHELIDNEYDFTFGYSVTGPARKWIPNHVDEIISNLGFENVKLFKHNKYTKEKTFIPRDEYLKIIERSKYTLIIPPYNVELFSLYRMIESLNRNCLPLISDKCVTADIINSFDLDASIIDEITIGKIDFKILNERYDIILKYLQDKICKFEKGINNGKEE